MEPKAEVPRTAIIEEQEAVTKKKPKRMWLLLGVGAALLAIASVWLFLSVQKPKKQTPHLTAEESEQLKYDSEQRKREVQKADQLRDQSYLVRKEDENQGQLNSLLKDLDIDKNLSSGLPTPMPESQARAEEEAIAHVLRNSNPARVQPESSYQAPRRSTQPAAAQTSTYLSTNPMFVYSRSFGGAKYVDAPQKQVATSADPTSIVSNKAVSKDSNQTTESSREEKASLIFTDNPPVTLYEGELLDAVLVNRLIADTEPSPVVCQLSKDVFDYNAQYVVLPAGSRIIGVSQVVTYKGAHRLFITFQRIILPNGPSIELPSNRKALKALDETGALGVVSKVDRHWFLQFGTAIFFGVLDGLSGAAQRSQDVLSTGSIIMGRTSENYERVLENIMSQYSSIVPTIRVDQGKTMKIYLSDDILITPYAKISNRSYYANH